MAYITLVCFIQSNVIAPFLMPKQTLHRSVDLLGRILLATVFVIAIPVKIFKFSAVVDAIVERGIPVPIAFLSLIVAIVCLICGSALLIFGDNQRLGASLLLAFLVPTTIVFHLFPFQSRAVFMNLGLIGGLVIALSRPKFNEDMCKIVKSIF